VPHHDDELERFETALGLPLGLLMRELVNRSEFTPGHGYTAFEPLELCLDLPGPIDGVCPDDVVLFGSMRPSSGHIGFVVRAAQEATSDNLPVCLVRSFDACVAALDLASFLSLAAVAGVDTIADDTSDEDYWARRRERLLDADFRAMSEILLALPGVELPAEPSLLTRAASHIELEYRGERPRIVSVTAARELLERGKKREASRVAQLVVDRFIELGSIVHASNWDDLARLLGAIRPRLTEKQRGALLAYGVRS
jgi:hypothetical protein